MSVTLKGGNLILRDLRVPESVRPGEAFTARVTVSNGALYISPFDADVCGDATGNGGYSVTTEFEGPTSTQDSQMCLRTTEIGTADETLEFTFTAPQEAGDHDVSARMVLPQSGSTSARLRGTITVSESAPAEPEPTPTEPAPGSGGTGDGGLPDWGGGGDGPLGELNQTATLAIVAVILLAIAWFASSASSTATTAGRVLG